MLLSLHEQLLQHLLAVDAGEQQVEDHEAEVVVGGQLQRVLAGARGLDGVPVGLQRATDEPRDARLVVDDKQVCHGFPSLGALWREHLGECLCAVSGPGACVRRARSPPPSGVS